MKNEELKMKNARCGLNQKVLRALFIVHFSLFIFHFLVASAYAHEMRPGYLEIRETAPAVYDVLWKVPARGDNMRLSLDVRFADDVEVLAEPIGYFRNNAHTQKTRIKRDGGLEGTPISIEGLSGTMTDVLVRIVYFDGTEVARRVKPDNPVFVVDAKPSPFQVAWTYFVLGVEHILLGIDHLLFVLALMLIVSDWKKLVGTITAFTIAHSITLALATLGFVHVPGPPVEAIIALSIVFVAVEIIRGRQGKPGLTARAPWVVAFTFGLLHGFGFAGALTEIGLPQNAIPMALLMFNVGVEVGQLLFVAILVVVYQLVVKLLIARLKLETPEWAFRLPAYLIGGVAAFWTIERVYGFL